LRDVLHAAAIKHRVVAVGDERAIEVGAEKANVGGHRAANLGFDRVTAIYDGSETDHEYDHDQEQEREMKSAYELAMERLEKKAPTVALTDDQKQQIAEIDSTFKARIAERELFLKGEIAKARETGNLEEAGTLQKQLTVDMRRLQEDAEAKKEKLRSSFSA
jgi:hypothetical protein